MRSHPSADFLPIENQKLVPAIYLGKAPGDDGKPREDGSSMVIHQVIPSPRRRAAVMNGKSEYSVLIHSHAC
jgi:hypothetical protein